jgi:GAF domain
MELQSSQAIQGISHLRTPPPLWFVTNGETIVGPVRTSLLLRGIRFGRVPDDCLVREMRWARWRHLGQIREIAALRRAQALSARLGDPLLAPPPSGAALRRRLDDATDRGEALLFGLHAAVAVTDAEVGFVHRVTDPFGEFVTSAAHGDAALELLGARLAPGDWMLAAARAGRSVIGAADTTRVHRAAAARLGRAEPVRAVAMVPVRRGHDLVAFLELGRTDHAFRGADVTALADVARAVHDRLG